MDTGNILQSNHDLFDYNGECESVVAEDIVGNNHLRPVLGLFNRSVLCYQPYDTCLSFKFEIRDQQCSSISRRATELAPVHYASTILRTPDLWELSVH